MKIYINVLVTFLLVIGLVSCAPKDTQSSDQSVTQSNEGSIDDATSIIDQIIDDSNSTEQSVSEPVGSNDTNADVVQNNNEGLQKYIDLNLVDKDGNPINLSDYEGKFIALNFFGVWCKYCMEEMPDLQEVYSEYGGDDFVILLVNATTTENIGKDGVKDWYEKGGYTMPMMMDLDGTALEIYPVSGFPTTYFINKDGYILGAIPGAMSKDTLLSILETYN